MDKLKEIIKKWSPELFKKLIRGIRFILSKRYVARLVRDQKNICLEIGAGSRKGANGWTTLDISGCDICWDLSKKLPFPDNSVHKIYSSHVLEHFTFQEGKRLLDECYRIMVPNGIFSICVPNARIYIEAYIRGEHLAENIYFQYKAAYNNTSRIDYVNHIAYMDGHHKYMFDGENLLCVLRNQGFKSVTLRDFDESIDMPERRISSIYAEAKK